MLLSRSNNLEAASQNFNSKVNAEDLEKINDNYYRKLRSLLTSIQYHNLQDIRRKTNLQKELDNIDKVLSEQDKELNF